MPSVTRRSSTGADRRAAVEARIIDATGQLLADGASFTELGVQRIAAEAGIARSTFYLHFRDKTELLIRLADGLAGGAFDLISESPPGEGKAGIIGGMVRDIGYYRQRRHLLAAVLEVVAYDAAASEFWNGQLERFIDLGEQWVRAEQEAGRTPRDIDARTVAQIFCWGGFQVVAQQVLNGPPERDELVAREIALFEWFGALRRPIGGSDSAQKTAR